MNNSNAEQKVSTRPSGPQSTPPSGAESGPSDDLSKAGTLAYIKHFPRPELGEHPMHDGYNVGRALGRAYAGDMQQVMEGFRQGVKDGTKAAEEAGGQRDE